MSNMVQAKVKIVGVRPMFFHKFGPEALPLEKQEKTGVAGHDPEEWRRTCMVSKDGQLYIRGDYIFGAMLGGAKYIKQGRASLQNPVAATLQIAEDRVLIDRFWPGYPNGHEFDVDKEQPPSEDSEEDVYLDIRGVVNPSTKGRNVRYRIATKPGWACEFTLIFDKTVVDRNSMESVLISAGQLVGVGNARKIGMGRFEVDSFECEDM